MKAMCGTKKRRQLAALLSAAFLLAGCNAAPVQTGDPGDIYRNSGYSVAGYDGRAYDYFSTIAKMLFMTLITDGSKGKGAFGEMGELLNEKLGEGLSGRSVFGAAEGEGQYEDAAPRERAHGLGRTIWDNGGSWEEEMP